MYSVTISGSSITELKNQIIKAANDAGYTLPTLTSAPVQQEIPVIAMPPKKKTGPKPKAVETPAIEETEEYVEPASDATDILEFDESDVSKEPTREETITALKKYNAEYGFEASKSLLGKFRVTKVADINPKDYSKVIAACNTAPVGK